MFGVLKTTRRQTEAENASPLGERRDRRRISLAGRFAKAVSGALAFASSNNLNDNDSLVEVQRRKQPNPDGLVRKGAESV